MTTSLSLMPNAGADWAPLNSLNPSIIDNCTLRTSFSILSWNANKLTDYEDLLLAYLGDHGLCPDIIAIQEPPINKKRFKMFKKSHKIVEACDLVVYCRPQFHTSVLLSTESASVIRISASDHHVFAAYLRNGSNTVGIRELLNLQFPLHSIIIGDLNAKLPSEHQSGNPAGKKLLSYLENSDFSLLNDLEHTFFRTGRQSSMLDLCLAQGLPLQGVCSTLRDLDFSDHRAILYNKSSSVSARKTSKYVDYYPLRSRNLHRNKNPHLLINFSSLLDSSLDEAQSYDWSAFRTQIHRALRKCGIRLSSPEQAPNCGSPPSAEVRRILSQRKKIQNSNQKNIAC